MAPVRPSGFVDPGWDHGIAQDEKKKKVMCNYCAKVVSGGIYRLKQHLARVSGEVTYCNKAPEEVYLRMKENLEGGRSNKKPRDNNAEAYINSFTNDDDDGYRIKGKQMSKNVGVKCTPLRSLGYIDPGWEHCIAQDERKKKVKCNYCEKIVSGGINRFKQHLARIPGEVAPCKHAPDHVFLKMKDNMKWHRTGRKQRRADGNEMSSFYGHSDSDDEDDEQVEAMSKEKMVGKDSSKTCKGKFATCGGPEPLLKRSRLDSVFMNTFICQTAEPYRPAKVKTVSEKRSRKEVISSICKFFYYAGIPLQASDSVYFHKMLDLVCQYGEGLAGPSSQLIGGRFLQDEIANIKKYLVDYKASWATTGCSVLADSWRDTQGRILINFLCSGPNGIYFVSSVDATEVIEDAFSMFKLLDKVVEEMGEDNVVQVITRNTQSLKAAGKMIEEKRRNIFWTPCAADCINHMLDDFMKIRCVGECMEKGKKITKFIYNQIWVLNLMKIEYTQGRELLRPAVTGSASSFATLQSLLDHRIALKRMFQSSKWVSSRCSKVGEGKEVEKIVLSPIFWKRVHFVVKSVDPIVQVLDKVVRGDGLSMPVIYSDMYRAKLAMKSIHGDDASKYGPFLDVVENHWTSLFYHPLYMAAHFLNPSYRYQPDFVTHTEVVRGLNECIARLEPDTAKRVSASMQLSDYNSAKADFGTELAISTRSELDPAAWWQQHGISCLELQRIAVRVLSQTCSSIGCEHEWSVYDQMYSQRHSLAAQRRLDELIYAHYNLRLRERHFGKRSILPQTQTQTLLLDDWITHQDKKHMLQDEEIICNEIEGNMYEDGTMDYESGNMETVKELVASVDVNFNSAGGCSEYEDDGNGEINYFDDDMSD